MGWNSSSTTVTNTPAPPTPEMLEADRLRLAELRRQNDIAEQMLPGQLDLIRAQRELIQYQLDHRDEMDEIQNQELELRRIQIQAAIQDAAMQEELRPEQLAYLRNQNALATEQAAAMRETTAFQREQNGYILDQLRDQSERIRARNAALPPEEEAAAAAEEFRRAQRMGGMSEEFARIQLEAAKRGSKPTDEQLANINEAMDAAQAQGESDISRYLKETLRTINEETAQAAGLRATDTPVVRLSERAGEEAARAQGDLTSKISENRALARLNYPLAESRFVADTAARGQELAAGAANFNNELRANAATNRALAFNLPGSSSFVMPQQAPTPSLNFMNPAAVTTNPNAWSFQPYNPNSSSTTTRNTASFMGSLGSIGQTASGIGSMLAGGAALFSDARLKMDSVRIGTTDAGLPIYKYRYKGDPAPRIGVMAQETARLFPDAVRRHKRTGFLVVDHEKVH